MCMLCYIWNNIYCAYSVIAHGVRSAVPLRWLQWTYNLWLILLQKDWRVTKVEMPHSTISCCIQRWSPPSEHPPILPRGRGRRSIRHHMNHWRRQKEIQQLKVGEAFDDYFKVCKNIIFEHTSLNKRNQLPNESIEQFIMEIHKMRDSYEFSVMKDELDQDIDSWSGCLIRVFTDGGGAQLRQSQTANTSTRSCQRTASNTSWNFLLRKRLP